MPEIKDIAIREQNLQAHTSQQFDSFAATFVRTVKEVNVIAEKGPSLLMISTSIIILAAVIFAKIFSFGLAGISTGDLIVICVTSLTLCGSGVFLRLYQYNKQMTMNRALGTVGEELLLRNQKLAAETIRSTQKLAEKTVENTPSIPVL